MLNGLIEKKRKGTTDTWLTPPGLLLLLGAFDLDPCAALDQPWPTAAQQYALPENDGLILPWHGRVFCNPPYSALKPWAEKMAGHRNGLLLCYARSDTRAFRNVWRHGDAVLFMGKRVAFCRPNGIQAGRGQAASVLVAFGKNEIPILREVKAAYGGGNRYKLGVLNRGEA